jgi:hypothetical protein
MEVAEQLAPLKASTKVFVFVRLLPPAAISATSILTEVQAAGVVKLYQTSYVTPQELVMPELVAKYNVPVTGLLQLVAGVSADGLEQSSDCARMVFDTKIEITNKVVVRSAACNMVYQDYWTFKKILR